MPVKNIMTKHVITVTLDTEVQHIKKIFDDIDIHHVIVLEDESTNDRGMKRKKVIGIISDRDVLRCVSPYAGTPAESARDTFTLSKKAHQIMTHKPFTVTPSSSIPSAARLMLEKGVGCLPVVEDHQLKGILSWKDLMAAALKENK